MTFTYTSAPPEGNLSTREVALWYARNRSGDVRNTTKARPDEDWLMELDLGSRRSTVDVTTAAPDGTDVVIPAGTRIYRPFIAAAQHVRSTLQHLTSDSGTQLTDPREAAQFLEDYQEKMDRLYGVADVIEGGNFSLLVRL